MYTGLMYERDFWLVMMRIVTERDALMLIDWKPSSVRLDCETIAKIAS